jgi:hypothetical protein
LRLLKSKRPPAEFTAVFGDGVCWP